MKMVRKDDGRCIGCQVTRKFDKVRCQLEVKLSNTMGGVKMETVWGRGIDRLSLD